ncbi:hypothetical protein AOL_s00215g371 [Orbilia oligospora ATCC 24927]|uniref:GATA-type domain-containing protein n=1 Tax=Arthrobotrys oligospora (strain ATCC 24927 / CBS 115.81 / DSM 1491) TaxID=756982 RepID=G1XU92_ARTOA|nr:hypothetical protein AOL_s00215g371 [Orbilia oligospora ATCC 24927]EGX43635.1 hypothetical protein AOL_s00215g371 [Orbilia oligospora ATCC 24927]
MADTKRKRSLRESTTRSTAKRQEAAKGVPAKSETPVEPSRPATPEPEVEEVPTSFEAHGPLPTSSQLQEPEALPGKEWKSISESAVLQTAFDRSRDVWLSGKMFDRYWTKPTKRKVVDLSNPPKDSMVKIGECMISIHPHVFEAKLYTVRDREKERQRDLEFLHQQDQYQAQLAQMPKVPVTKPLIAKPTPTKVAIPQSVAADQSNLNGQKPGHPGSPRNPNESGHLAWRVDPKGSGQANGNGHSRPVQTGVSGSPTNGSPPPPLSTARPSQSNSGPDPVIQLLATRASNDPNLKALMRVVAAGQANKEQLAAFQAHIDELTPLARASAAAKAQRAALGPPTPSSTPQSPSASSPTTGAQTAPRPTYQPIQPAGPVPARSPENGQTVIPRQTVTVLPKPKQLSVADRKHLDIKDVVFEFSIATIGDRYYIPRKSILEYRQKGTQLLVSYLYISEVDKTFQPITITINAPTPRTLEPISRVVEPKETVQAYMKDIMSRYSRANHGYLLMRLKRDEAEILAAQEAEARRLKEEEEIKKRLAKAATEAAAAEEMMYKDLLKREIPKPATSIVKSKKKSHLTLDDGVIALDLPKPKLKTKYSRKGRIADPSKNCHLCGTNKTSLWRRAEIDGETVVVCNACGIKWKTNQDKKERGETPLEYGPKMVRIKKEGAIRTGKTAVKTGRLMQAMMESVIRVEPGELSDTIVLSGMHQLTPEASTQHPQTTPVEVMVQDQETT